LPSRAALSSSRGEERRDDSLMRIAVQSRMRPNCCAAASTKQSESCRCFHGAPDTYVEITARMNGWEVRTFPELHVQHHRQTGSARGLIRGRFRQGRKDYSFGYLPDFEILKCIRRISETPFLWGSAARFAGYCWSALRRERPAVSKEFLDFLRNEQRLRVRRALQFSLVARADANR